jgi:two-component system sensor histidine kinase RegB
MMASLQIANDGSRLRLNTTIKLRWFAVAGQAVTVLSVFYGYRFPLPLDLCLGVIGLSAILNVALTLAYPRPRHLPARHAALLLGFDITQLAALIFLTGGLENPFAFLLVVPVAVSASTQPLAVTVALTALEIALTTLLAKLHFPLPWANHAPPELPLLYIAGIWTALVSCIAFIAFYSWRIGQETRQMSQALTAAELILAREQRLSALDGLAAAAAHQLGTPLSTIALVAKELEREVPLESPWREDITLLRSQAARCRDILSELSKSGPGREDDYFAQIPLTHLIEEVVAPLRTTGVDIKVRVTDAAPSSKPSGEPIIPRNPGLIHALVNLVDNATDFALSSVTVDASYDQDKLRLRIADDGPGFPANIINYLGEPYITSRPRSRTRGGEGGMGLGFFIAKTFLERSGATVAAENRTPPATGAMVQIVWPRARIESAV